MKMEIEITEEYILKTKYGRLCFKEDEKQQCLYIWVEADLNPTIEVDGNQICITTK